MSQEIILHIGMPKTGSSALQATLYRLSQQMQEQGIYYPIPKSGGYEWKANRGMVPGNAQVFVDVVGDEANINSVLADLEVTLMSSIDARVGYKKTILSSEVLSILATKRGFWTTLSQIESKLDVRFKVVVYLRNPFSYFLSCYGQAIKAHGFAGTLDEFVNIFVDTSSVLSFSVYRHIRDVFSWAEKSNISLEFFHYEAAIDGIVPHFFQNVLERELRDFNYQTVDSFNESLTPFILEFHRGINLESSKLGNLFGFERSDPLLNFQTKTLREIDIQPVLNNISRNVLLSVFEAFREDSRNLLHFHSEMSFAIDAKKVCIEQSAHDMQILQQVFELGRFVALSFKHGYIKWDKN